MYPTPLRHAAVDAGSGTLERDWTQLLAGASIELLPEQAFSFEPNSGAFASGAYVFLPHVAGKSLERQREAASHLLFRGHSPVTHLSARNFTSMAEFESHVAALNAAGIKNCLAIGGVPSITPNPVMHTAAEMITSDCFKSAGFENVFIAGHPEGLKGCSEAELNAALLEKIEILQGQGRSVQIVTQFAFDGAVMAEWAAKLRSLGVDVPIRFGLAGVTSLPKLIKFAVLCGVGASLSVLRRQAGSVFKVMRDYNPGDVIQALDQGLRAHETTGVRMHFFPFGGWEKTAEWIEAGIRS
jgi:methylenetetrahydrofolate reductase (NADPH)